jgi:hypothetical protein
MRVENGCGFTDHMSPVMIILMTMFIGYVAPSTGKGLQLSSFSRSLYFVFRFFPISYSSSYFPSFFLFMAKWDMHCVSFNLCERKS